MIGAQGRGRGAPPAAPTGRGGTAAFVTREVRLPKLGSRIDIPGSFWTGTAPADRNRLFAVVVIEQAKHHRFNARTAGPAVRLQQMADLDSDEISLDAVPGLWVLAKVWHDYEKAHKVSGVCM